MNQKISWEIKLNKVHSPTIPLSGRGVLARRIHYPRHPEDGGRWSQGLPHEGRSGAMLPNLQLVGFNEWQFS
jgi:hypothetical protein